MSGQSGGHRLILSKLNDQLKCTLCTGYLIDATTIIECLHSFCRSCIVKYLETNKYCPICEVLVHKSKPLLNIRPDHTLQDIVYKLVPGCYQNEMRCRREFYSKHPEGKNAPMSPESRGEPIESHIYSPDESLSLSLEYYNPSVNSDNEEEKEAPIALPRRYLRCPAAVTVFHLQKLIRAKYGLSEAHRVDIMYKEEPLCGSYTLMDVMYIYHWRRKVPLHLSYRIFESSTKRLKLAEDNSEFKQSLTNSGISPVETKDEQSSKRGWKEVQLKISEAGVMSVTDITSPDSKKSTKLDDQSGSSTSGDLVENLETLQTVNKSLALDEGTSKTSTTKSKADLDEKKVSQDAKRKETFDTKSPGKRETKERDNRQEKKLKETVETREIKEKKDTNKREKREINVKNKREEAEVSSRLQETEKLAKLNQKKNANLIAGSKIDALSAKLQFQPKVGQVNNTYSKKNLKKQSPKMETRKDVKKLSESSRAKNSEEAQEVGSNKFTKILEILSKSAESSAKNAKSEETGKGGKSSSGIATRNSENATKSGKIEEIGTRSGKSGESGAKNAKLEEIGGKISTKSEESGTKSEEVITKNTKIDEPVARNAKSDGIVTRNAENLAKSTKNEETKSAKIGEIVTRSARNARSEEIVTRSAKMVEIATRGAKILEIAARNAKNAAEEKKEKVENLEKKAESKIVESTVKNVENNAKSGESKSVKNTESLGKNADNAELAKNTENLARKSDAQSTESLTKVAKIGAKNPESPGKKQDTASRIAENVSKIGDNLQKSQVSKSTMNSLPTYVTAPSISSVKSQGMSLQQALNSLGKVGDPKSLLNQLSACQKANFRNNNENLVSTAMMMSQGTNFGFMLPDLGMMSSKNAQLSKIQASSSGGISVPASVHSLVQASVQNAVQASVQASVQSAVQSLASIQSPLVQSSLASVQSLGQSSQNSPQIQSFQGKSMAQFNVQPSMSIYSISEKNHLYNQSSTSSKSDFEITSVYPVSTDSIPISLMKSAIRKHEVIAKGTNLNEICAKIGTSGSKINEICAKIGENSKEKNKTETRRADLPDLLKISKSTEFLKHIPNIPNVPIYTPSGNSKDSKNCGKIQQKKHPHVGYKTLRDPPKTWNPTLSKNNYVAVKNQNQFADGGSSKPIQSKPAKIFKMRNMPRYLGNPASGVKPMYGIANEKEKEVSKNNLHVMTMMKIDPKTLSPIVSTTNSPIVSPPPYSPNARSYQNTPFSREMCRNSGSPISPRNSPVNMLSTNPFIPSPTPNTNPRLIYSHFPPPFPDASRFPNPLIRTPVGIPPPSAFHSSLPPSINKLFQRSSYIPQTSGYNQPPTVQRIPPSTHSSPKLSPTSSANFGIGKMEAVSSSSEIGKDRVFNLSKAEERIDLEMKINGDIVDLEEEEERVRREEERRKGLKGSEGKGTGQGSNLSSQGSKGTGQGSKRAGQSEQSLKESSQSINLSSNDVQFRERSANEESGKEISGKSLTKGNEIKEESKEGIGKELRKGVSEESRKRVNEDSRKRVNEDSRNRIQEGVSLETIKGFSEESRKKMGEESKKEIKEELRDGNEETKKGLSEEARTGVSEESRKGISEEARKGIKEELRKGVKEEREGIVGESKEGTNESEKSEPKEEGSSPEGNLNLEKREIAQIDDLEKEIQGKKTEIQRNEAES